MKTKWSNEVIITYKGEKIEEVMLYKYLSSKSFHNRMAIAIRKNGNVTDFENTARTYLINFITSWYREETEISDERQ